MGLFDKEFCDVCGDKINKLTQQKLSDGHLCSDCKHKLGSFTSGWKTRTVADVKKHLELREQNKAKYQQFNCSATAGGRNNSIQADFSKGQFIFAIDNRDYKSGNPQVFEFSQLQDFWLEQDFRSLSDSDGDGIPDNRDNFDNRQLNNAGAFGGVVNSVMNGINQMNNSMVNVPLSAQPFIRNSSTSSSYGSMQEVSGIKACFKVSDPYITKPIEFSVAYISSGTQNQMELMNAYEAGVQIMQLCQQMKGGAAPQMQGGYAQPMQQQGGYQRMQQQPMQGGYAQQPMQQQPMQGGYAQQPMQQQPMQGGYAQQPMQGGYAQQPMQGGYAQQPMQAGGAWVCPNCGTQNTSNFCAGCGAPRQ